MYKKLLVNYTEGEGSPLLDSNDGGFMKVDKKAELNQIKNVIEWKEKKKSGKDK